MKIAFNTLVDNPLKPTGSMVFFEKIIEELSKLDKDNEYYILVSPKNRHFFKVEQNNFTYVNCFVSQEKRILRVLVSQIIIPIRLWQNKIDVYFCPQNVSPFIIPNRAKVFIYLYGTHHWKQENYLGLLRTIYRNILSWLAKYQAEKFLANSEACRKDIIENLKVSESKVAVISEALDNSLFNSNPMTESEFQLLKDHNIRYKKYILFVSMIYYYKNVHTLIDAFGKINKEFPDYTLVLIGRNDLTSTKSRLYFKKILDSINNLRLNEKVKFIGQLPHDKLPAFYKGAKIFIQPSFYETFGKPVIEAMACGTPVIGSNTGATPEVIGDSGLVFDPNSSQDLSNKIALLLNDEKLYKSCSERGMVRAGCFTFKKQAKSLLTAFANDVNLS